MKVAIVTSLLALGTGLTGVLGAPARDVNSGLALHGDDLANVVARGNGMIVGRDDDRKKKKPHYNPTWCGAPFCGAESVKERDETASLTSREGTAPLASRDETACLASRDDDRKKKAHYNPTWCGAPFCNSESVVIQKERGEESASLASREEEHKKPRPHDPVWCGAPFCARDALKERDDETASLVSRDEVRKTPRPKDPYWCGEPFCARDAAMTKRELDSAPIEKRAEDITKCWEAPDGQIHCQWDKRDGLVKREEAISKCWEAPDGQLFCDSAADLSKHSRFIKKCWESGIGQIHCQYAKPAAVVNDTVKCRQSPQGLIHCEWAGRGSEIFAECETAYTYRIAADLLKTRELTVNQVNWYKYPEEHTFNDNSTC
ncbi:MAG: hypothetical protein Q9195_005191 [Heterodermia aff. obscurata]